MTTYEPGTVLARLEPSLESLSSLGPSSEKLGQLDDQAAKTLRESGVIRMLQPKDFGGYEAHPREFAETVMKVAAADGASGWVAGIVGVHPWEMAMADRRVQEEIWGENPDTWIASPYAPMGVATPTSEGDEPGYILRGRWQFSSGTDHCDWIFLGALLGNEAGKPLMPPTILHVILPRKDYTIVPDSWDVVGLRGTGSKDVIVDGAFIPAYRTLDFAKVAEGIAPKEAGLSAVGYHVPFSCVFPLGITSAVIGICEGGAALHASWQAGRTTISGAQSKDDPYALYALSEAMADIRASRAALLANVTEMYDAVAAGHTPTFAQRAQGRRTQVQAAWRAVRALDEIVARSGGNAMRLDNPIQRFWRDAHTGLAHAIHVTGSVFHAAGLADLGLEPPAGPLRAMI